MVCACARLLLCACVQGGGKYVDGYVHLSMNESIERVCVFVCTNFSMCNERV